jgi:hypothetical protein
VETSKYAEQVGGTIATDDGSLFEPLGVAYRVPYGHSVLHLVLIMVNISR